ncbi:hypothetical protein AAY473_034427 [Plecturocebus cupreus]
MESHYVAQASLELLGLSDPPASASQSDLLTQIREESLCNQIKGKTTLLDSTIQNRSIKDSIKDEKELPDSTKDENSNQ